MYSDFLESPSKGCTSFNDPFQAYDMTEMNEISNQTNLDYIFDSYYSTRVSQYDTGFELPEDCKNMSFSELFDQELFSTQENKDCKITIKIEKEEPLTSCFSCDDSQDIPNSHSLVQYENNIPVSSTLSKNLVSKKGINRTIIKNNDKCDVSHLMNNPFSESENSEKHQVPTQSKTLIIKQEPKDTTSFQITSDNCFVKNEDENVLSLKSSSPKQQCINWASIETTNNCDYQDLIYNTFKPEPIHDNNDIKQNIDGMIFTPYNSIDGLQNAKIGHCLKQNDDFSSLSDMSTLKHPGINSVSVKMPENRHVDDLKYKVFCKKDDTGIGQVPVNIEFPNIKCKPKTIVDKNIIDTETITCYPVNNSHNTSNCHKFIKVELVKNGLLSPLSNNCTKKNQDINKSSVKIVKNCGNIKQLINKPCKIVTSGIDQTLFKVQTPIVKYESVNHCKVLSSAPKSLVLSHQGIKTSIKIIKSHNVTQLANNSFGKTQNLNINQSFMKVKTPLIKCEPKYDSDHTIKDNTVNIIPFSSNVDFKSIIDNQRFVKIENDHESSSSKSSPKHCETINNFIKISENNNIKNSIPNSSRKSENSDINQLSVKVVTPIVKQEPEEIVDAIKQNITTSEITPSYSGANSQCAILSDSITKHKKDFITVLSESLTLKRRVIKRTSVKTSGNKDVKQLMKKCVDEVKVLDDDQTKKIKEVEDLGIEQIKEIKKEPEAQDTNSSVEETFVEGKGTIKNELNDDDSNDLYKINLNNTDIENQVAVTKEQNENNDAISLDCTVENEKKKITWEEFRAKREKMGLSIKNEDFATDSIQTENYKLEAIKEEFDRNTAAHFINLKRQIEDIRDTNNIVPKETNNKEDQELQNKRRKIEYIQKLLPSSFASEIAKTSSLMKGVLEDNENHITSDYSIISNDKIQKKYDDSYEDPGYLKKDDKFQKKCFQTRVNSFRSNQPKFNYPDKSSRSSSVSSNPDNCYNRNKIDATQKGGQYSQNVRNIIQRTKEQKRVVYVGQIPIRYGKRYLHTRFKEFGSIQSLTLHRKPDFRVYYAFVTYSEKAEAERAINHGNDDKTQVQLDIRFGERKQTQTPYYDLDDEWLTDWYRYNPQPVAVVRPSPSLERASFEEELQEFYKLAQIKKLNHKSSQVS